MKVPEHAHPLELIDLQQEEEEEEEEDADDDEDGGDLTVEEGFRCRCGRCGEEITMYQRYYYKCTTGSCDYSLHKFCAELSTRLVHASHPHPLTLVDVEWRFTRRRCGGCYDFHGPRKMQYECSSCYFLLDITCSVDVRKKVIYHPCHPHLLMSAIRKPILCECRACGKEHKGVFYQCTTCDFFTVHKDCLFLPKKLLIQQTTRDAFYHTHPLTISYFFPEDDQIAKHYPRCRVCGFGFLTTEYLWTYKCDKCLYYAHVGCATSLPAAGFHKINKNFKDVDHPHLLHLPFPDVSYSLPKHILFEESRSRVEEVNLKHKNHQHPLILVDQKSSKKIDSRSLMCHDPMKKIQLLCNGCVRPITTTPFFKCADEDENCNFALHEWCTRMPEKIENHPKHSQHTLVLMENNLKRFFGVFDCAVCRLPCNGFAYCCDKCGYYVDVTCGLMPIEITHKAHPSHLLTVASFVDVLLTKSDCLICHESFHNSFPTYYKKEEFAFVCKECDTYIHSTCAFLLPETIRHTFDKHPIHLSYLPIENHKSEYFCEICEEDLNPLASFYHCQECVQSIHTTCAPSILQSETETETYLPYNHSQYKLGIYYFMNIKFGGILNTDSHPHPLLFSQGTVLNGQCSMCGTELRYKMIFKCLECNFAIDYKCCEQVFS